MEKVKVKRQGKEKIIKKVLAAALAFFMILAVGLPLISLVLQ